MTEKIVLIGAGSAMFTRGLVADLIKRDLPCDLGLIDIAPHALAVAEGLVRKMITAKRAPITLRASINRRDVLPGATVVICTVGVGGRRAGARGALFEIDAGGEGPFDRLSDHNRPVAAQNRGVALAERLVGFVDEHVAAPEGADEAEDGLEVAFGRAHPAVAEVLEAHDGHAGFAGQAFDDPRLR